MSTTHGGTVCVHLDATHMAALHQLADELGQPLQIVAAQILRELLEHQQSLARLAANAATIRERISHIEQRLATLPIRQETL